MTPIIKANIVADSIGPDFDPYSGTPKNSRLTTFVCEFPRFILSEINTHRMLSRNTASSRAIPNHRMIENIRENPACPVEWGKNKKGMQADENLTGSERKRAEEIWCEAREKMIASSESLASTGVHKQISNRLLEPWFTVRSIISATDWGNFFSLRVHRDAQPEFAGLAREMLDEYNRSEPAHLLSGMWHVPFGDNIDRERVKQTELFKKLVEDKRLCEDKACVLVMLKIATARCARVSYLNFEGKDDYEADIRICDKLFGSLPKHLSPAEHVAMCYSGTYGNFRGFKQYRKFFSDENLEDDRIKAHKWDRNKANQIFYNGTAMYAPTIETFD